jgi:hypothetical protein
MYCRRSEPIIKISQGDIYKDLEVVFDIKCVSIETGEMEYTEITYTHSIVLTQDCDLEQDYKNREAPEKGHDKYIPCVLLAPAYLAEQLRDGVHLKDVGLSMQKIVSNLWNSVKKNQSLRYHFLAKNLDFNIPDLVVDFKHYFTIPRNFFCEIVIKDKYTASLAPLYREHLSDRFTHYLSRIGLPEPEPDVQVTQQA